MTGPENDHVSRLRVDYPFLQESFRSCSGLGEPGARVEGLEATVLQGFRVEGSGRTLGVKSKNNKIQIHPSFRLDVSVPCAI